MFLCMIFLANVVPHFIHGISGDSFPTPFANPPGKGLSSPRVNVLWSLLNLVIGYVLFRAVKFSNSTKFALVIFFVGIVTCSLMLSIAFVEKEH